MILMASALAMSRFGRAGAVRASWGREETIVSVGTLIALLVLLAAFVLFVVGRMDGVTAAMFGGLAFAILLTVVPLPWRSA